MKPFVKYLLLGFVLVFAEAIYICWFSFRFERVITLMSYGGFLIGWGLAIYPATGYYFPKIKNNYILNTIYGALIVGSVLLFSSLADVRVSYILSHYPTKITTAAVIATRTGGKNSSYATLKYHAESIIIQEEISNQNFEYKPGRSFLIKYSVEYPAIFTVIKRVENY